MKFTLEIRNQNSSYIVDIEREAQGLYHLDQARAKFTPEITAEEISATTASVALVEKKLILTEEQARKTGKYEKTWYSRVYVPHKWLEKYYKATIVKTDYGEYRVEYYFDEKSCFDAWEKAGFPLYWGCKPAKKKK